MSPKLHLPQCRYLQGAMANVGGLWWGSGCGGGVSFTGVGTQSAHVKALVPQHPFQLHLLHARSVSGSPPERP